MAHSSQPTLKKLSLPNHFRYDSDNRTMNPIEDRPGATAWTWLNEPSCWNLTPSHFAVQSEARTDFWRLTHDGDLRDNGHFYFHPVTGNFQATVTIEGQFKAQYDQSGIMLRHNALCWMKCGIEFVDGTHYASAVVTRQDSDWSTVPLAPLPNFRFTVKRHGDLVEVYHLDPHPGPTLIRQATIPFDATLQLGLMTASPKGEGFETRFRDWQFQAEG